MPPRNEVVGGYTGFTMSICRQSNNSGKARVKIVKNKRDPPLFTGKLLIKFQNILRNTTQVIRGGSLLFLTIFTVAVPELLDLI
jgi:hypothetical protein